MRRQPWREILQIPAIALLLIPLQMIQPIVVQLLQALQVVAVLQLLPLLITTTMTTTTTAAAAAATTTTTATTTGSSGSSSSTTTASTTTTTSSSTGSGLSSSRSTGILQSAKNAAGRLNGCYKNIRHYTGSCRNRRGCWWKGRRWSVLCQTTLMEFDIQCLLPTSKL